MRLPTLEPGTYHIEATMELTNGRTLGPMKGQFIKKDEAKSAHWWKNEYGNVERVLPPYTALVQQDKAWPAWAAPTTSTPWACPSASLQRRRRQRGASPRGDRARRR